MKDIKFIEEQLELLLEFKPNTEYSKSYLSPKDKMNKLYDNCTTEDIFFEITDVLILDLDYEFDLHEKNEHFGIGVSYFEAYDCFRNEMINEINRKNFLLNRPQLIEDANIDFNELDASDTRTKIILLKELGVLKSLEKKFAFQSQTQFARLIAILITGKNEKLETVNETVRKALSNVHIKNQTNSLYTLPQIAKVNTIFSSFGIPNIK